MDKCQQLYDRLDAGLQGHLSAWSKLPPDTLVMQSREITAIRDAHEYLTETHGLEPEEVDYLLSLDDPLQAVADKWMERMGDLSDFSFALDDLFQHMPQDLAQKIYNGSDIEKVVCSYYFGNNECNMERVISRCQQNEQVQKYVELYDQIISAYRIDHYLIACIGLFSLIDGVLADVSEQTTTNFKRRLDVVKEKMGSEKKLSEIDRKTLCIYKAFKSFDTSIFSYSKFSEQEPQIVNRHWDLHGRTHREHSKMDFLKVLLWLDVIIFSSIQDIQESEEVNDGHL